MNRQYHEVDLNNEFWEDECHVITTGLTPAVGGTELYVYYSAGNTFVVVGGEGFNSDPQYTTGIITPEEALLDYLRNLLGIYAQESDRIQAEKS